MQQVITFHYNLKDKSGKIIDSSDGGEPIAFLEGSGQIIKGLEKILITLNKGDKKEAEVPYQEGYGAYDQNLIYKIPRSKFPPGPVKVGDMFQISNKEGSSRVVTIVDLSETEATLDANHPLAGENLFFNIEIVDRRDATAEEISHGHAHGPGHDHH